MKDIKFRAWDIAAKKMRVVTQLFFEDGDLTQVNTKTSGWLNAKDEVVLVQFTGLTDKNGKEIYEGDIVRGGELEGDHGSVVYEIAYNEGGDYPAFDLKGWRGETNGICFFINDAYIEVIGNIYENPELLDTN